MGAKYSLLNDKYVGLSIDSTSTGLADCYLIKPRTDTQKFDLYPVGKFAATQGTTIDPGNLAIAISHSPLYAVAFLNRNGKFPHKVS